MVYFICEPWFDSCPPNSWPVLSLFTKVASKLITFLMIFLHGQVYLNLLYLSKRSLCPSLGLLYDTNFTSGPTSRFTRWNQHGIPGKHVLKMRKIAITLLILLPWMTYWMSQAQKNTYHEHNSEDLDVHSDPKNYVNIKNSLSTA